MNFIELMFMVYLEKDEIIFSCGYKEYIRQKVIFELYFEDQVGI